MAEPKIEPKAAPVAAPSPVYVPQLLINSTLPISVNNIFFIIVNA